MRTVCGILVGCLTLSAAPFVLAEEADGLMLPRLQTRVRLGMASPADAAYLSDGTGKLARLSSASVLGDYYFSRSAAADGESSGFRATTGVFLGSQLGMWGGYAPATLNSSLVSVERYSFSLAAPRGNDLANQDNGAVPYLGIGYSGTSLKGGFSFSADLGLMALNPGNGVRLERALGGGQSLEDMLREVRLSPLVQFAVSYQF